MIYFWLKLIHILSSTLLFGTGLGSAFYMLNAHLSKDDKAILITSRNLVIADWLFTTPAIIIQPITGIWLMINRGYPFTTSWILLSLGLFLLAGACWLPVVWLQIKIRNLAEEAIKIQSPLWQNLLYLKYMKIWFILGWPAFIAVIIIFYLMVFKPVL